MNTQTLRCARRAGLYLAHLALALGIGHAAAHDNGYFDSHPTPHGGQVRMAGAYHVEAVIEEQRLVLYVTDHADQAQSTDAWQGRATVLNGTEVARVALAPAGDNRLRSDAPVNVGAASTMAVLLQPPQAEALQLSFTPGTALGHTAARHP